MIRTILAICEGELSGTRAFLEGSIKLAPALVVLDLDLVGEAAKDPVAANPAGAAKAGGLAGDEADQTAFDRL